MGKAMKRNGAPEIPRKSYAIALVVASVFVFRRKPDYWPPFRVPGYPVVPAVFIVATILILGNAIVDHTSRLPTLAVLGVILLGIPIHWIVERRSLDVR